MDLMSTVDLILQAGGPGSGRKPTGNQIKKELERIAKIPWKDRTPAEHHYVAKHDPRQKSLFGGKDPILKEYLEMQNRLHAFAFDHSINAGGPGSGRHPYGRKELLSKMMKSPKGVTKLANVFRNTLSKEDIHKMSLAREEEGFRSDKAKTENVPINKLGYDDSFQPNVDNYGVLKYYHNPQNVNPEHKNYVNWSSMKLPRIMEFGGKYFIHDGHHRIVAAHLRGEDSIKANVWHVKKRDIEAGGPGSGRHPWGRKPKPMVEPREKILNKKGWIVDPRRSQLGKEHASRVGKEEQQKAEEMEAVVASAVKGEVTGKNSEVVDVILKDRNGRLHGIEHKTILKKQSPFIKATGRLERVDMTHGAIPRKTAWARKFKVTLHTVATDLREGKLTVYHANGVGGFTFGNDDKARMKSVSKNFRGLNDVMKAYGPMQRITDAEWVKMGFNPAQRASKNRDR